MPRLAYLSLACAVACLAGCGSDASAVDSGPPESFIALGRDFEGFRGWHRFEVAGEAVPEGVLPGPTFVYARDLPPADATRFPIGTMVVKAIEPGESLADWTVHAMVKRSADFNPHGAVGWEFFELSLDAGGAVAIVWRGEGPPSGHGYGARSVDSGGADGGTIPLVCNDCHAAAWMSDGVLTPALAPGG